MKLVFIGSILFIFLLTNMIPSDALSIVRSNIYNFSQKEIVLDGSAFSGFYYDIDDNSSGEMLTLRLSSIDPNATYATLSDKQDAGGNRGVVYVATPNAKNFDFRSWGQYEKIYFMGKGYFVAYDSDITSSMTENQQLIPLLYDNSKNKNLMTNGQIDEILIDDDSEQIINSSKPLKLEEGYQLAIKTIDIGGKKILAELSKDGRIIDSKVIQPSIENSKIDDETYYYKMNLGSTKDVVTIAVHFKSVMSGSGTVNAGVDGIFQISDKPIQLEADQVNPITMTVTIDNKNNKFMLSKNKDIMLMQNVYIKTADQDLIDAHHPLRYYVYTTKPDTYTLHSSIANLGMDQITWNNATFPGFYYDIDSNVGNEKIKFKLSSVKPDNAVVDDQADSSNNRGIVYTTNAQNKDFKFKPWGQYKIIGFLGEGYFAAFDNTIAHKTQNADDTSAYLYEKSNETNLIVSDQISKILMDSDTEKTITSSNPLELDEGYQLSIKSVDIGGDKAYVELTKKGKLVDSKIIQPSMVNATMKDKTYYYKRNLGDTKEIILIAVHFKNAFAGPGANIATVDGIFQISDATTSLKAGQQYEMMSVLEVNPTAMTVKMDNKGNKFILSKNKDIRLMGNIYINTADQGDISADNPLRYYLYKYVTIDVGASVTGVAAKNSEVAEFRDNVTTKNNNITSNAKVSKDNATNIKGEVPGAEAMKQPSIYAQVGITVFIFLIIVVLLLKIKRS